MIENNYGLRFGICQIKDFGPWTHGKEEQEVLTFQSRFYSRLGEKVLKLGGFVVTQRSDNIYFIANGINEKQLKELSDEFQEEACGLRLAVVDGFIPSDLEKRASQLLDENKKDNLLLEFDNNIERFLTIMSHYDLVGFNGFDSTSIYDAETLSIQFGLELRKLSERWGALSWYSSGDNFLSITNGLSLKDQHDIYDGLIAVGDTGNKYRLRVGIGINCQGAKAATFSAFALDNIRIMEKSNQVSIEKAVIPFGELLDLKYCGYIE